jgi:hypothetical protein
MQTVKICTQKNEEDSTEKEIGQQWHLTLMNQYCEKASELGMVPMIQSHEHPGSGIREVLQKLVSYVSPVNSAK